MPEIHGGFLFKRCAIEDHQYCGGGSMKTWCTCPCHEDRDDYEASILPPTDAELEAMAKAMERDHASP